ncbi:putative cytoplasmic protein [Streptomyces sp. Tu6071]|nr:putative cytoplasmic protein [Streptomyces sp. Tu6071]
MQSCCNDCPALHGGGKPIPPGYRLNGDLAVVENSKDSIGDQ